MGKVMRTFWKEEEEEQEKEEEMEMEMKEKELLKDGAPLH